MILLSCESRDAIWERDPNDMSGVSQLLGEKVQVPWVGVEG